MKTWEQARAEIKSLSEEEKNASRQLAKAALPPEPIRTIVKEALHTVAMECGPFTLAELAEFDKIAAGEKTTGEYRAEILAEIERNRQAHPEKYTKSGG